MRHRRQTHPRPRITYTARFPYLLSHWTAAKESLFDLSREELETFAALINEAQK